MMDDRTAFNQIGRELLKNAVSETETGRIKNCLRYLCNNREAITIYHRETCGGSCTGGHVSHVLSSCLNSSLMSWGKEGLKQIAELRTYYSSGDHVRLEHLKHAKFKHNVSKKLAKATVHAFSVHREVWECDDS